MTTDKDAAGVNPDIMDVIEGHQRFREQFERDRPFYQSLATRK